MKRLRLAAALLAALALAVAVSASGATKPVKLVGTVGPNFTIGLTKGGKAVKTLPPGKYSLSIVDRSSFHNFHLTGPGVNKTSTVAEVRTLPAMTITLKTGTYKFVCDPHKSQMKGSFKVK